MVISGHEQQTSIRRARTQSRSSLQVLGEAAGVSGDGKPGVLHCAPERTKSRRLMIVIDTLVNPLSLSIVFVHYVRAGLIARRFLDYQPCAFLHLLNELLLLHNYRQIYLPLGRLYEKCDLDNLWAASGSGGCDCDTAGILTDGKTCRIRCYKNIRRSSAVR